MSDSEQGRDPGDDLPAYMDLLSHDILNMNQTVLSCIDLMTASQGLDDRSRRHALRATSQMNISSQIFESIKTLCLHEREEGAPSESVDLEEATSKARRALSNMLPDREIRVDVEKAGGKAVVLGNKMVYHALLNALTNMAQLDAADVVDIDIHIGPAGDAEARAWKVRISDANAAMPESFDPDSLRTGTQETRTRMVRVAGLLLSKMMTERLGGSIEVETSDEKGCAFVLTLKEGSFE